MADKVFESMCSVLRQAGLPPRFAERIENRYWNTPPDRNPWVRLAHQGVEFVVGWRKRVIEIKVTAFASFDVRRIASLARHDGVTYQNDGPSLLAARSTYVIVHANSEGRASEYLTAILNGLRSDNE